MGPNPIQCEGMVYFSASDFKSLCGVVVPCSPPIYAVSASQEEMEALVLQALSFQREQYDWAVRVCLVFSIGVHFSLECTAPCTAVQGFDLT